MIILSWPAKELSPNARCHWAIKAKAAKAYRKEAGWATIESKEKSDGDGLIYMHLYFYPPDKRRYDEDNLIARMKSGLDGIADGLVVNDCRFRVTHEVCRVIKGGEVRVVVTA